MDALETVRRLISSVEGFDGGVLTPLAGGITNRNFVATLHGRRVVLRLPGERTELLAIDRTSEAAMARRAAELGVGPAVVGELAEVGTVITELVDGTHLEPAAFIERLAEVVPHLRTFHASEPISASFPIHRVVEWHARDASANGVAIPDSYARLHAVSEQIEVAFARRPEPMVPCHNDLLPGNVLFGTERIWLLDFEYAGMNDRYFDLANLSVNCGLDPAADEHLLQLYFGGVTRHRWARLQLMKIMSELREGMWAVVQQAISTLDTDFVGYATQRLENGERLAAQPDFSKLLDEASTDHQ